MQFTQTPGRQTTNNQILNSEHEQIAIANSTHQTSGTQTWIKRDHLLSETNPFSLLNTITLDTMTKTMDSFSDGSTITQSGLNAFDVELMTPIIDHQYENKEKKNACTWNNSLHSETLDTFDSQFSSILNSPPESVNSNDDQCINAVDLCDENDKETSYSFDNVDAYNLGHMKNHQEYALDFEEIEEIACGYSNIYNNNENELEKSTDESTRDTETPILGDDFMFNRLTNSQTKISDTFLNIKNEDMTNNDTVEMETETVVDMETEKVSNTNSTIEIITAQPKSMFCKPKSERKKLKLIIPPALQHVNASDMSNKIHEDSGVLSTPQITQDILDLEEDFDLVKYIDSENQKPETIDMVETNFVKPKTEEPENLTNIEYILPTPVASPVQHAQIDDETSATTVNLPAPRASKRRAASVLSNIYSDDSPPKRSRGRPPKTEPVQISAAELKKLSASDQRYYLMRLKNNEASRRSRLSRKSKEDHLFDELARLEEEHDRLKQKDDDLEVELKCWRKRLMKLAKL